MVSGGEVYGARPGFSLVEAVLALMLLGFGALAAASAQGWVARALARAHTLEEGVAAVELALDSLVQDTAPASGTTGRRGLRLEWDVTGDARAGEVLLRLTAPGRDAGVEDSFGVVLRAPPPRLDLDTP